MDSVVIGKFGYREPDSVIPVILPLVYEEAQELLNFLVDIHDLPLSSIQVLSVRTNHAR